MSAWGSVTIATFPIAPCGGFGGLENTVVLGVRVGLVVVAVSSQRHIHEGRCAVPITVALVQIINAMYTLRQAVMSRTQLP